MKDYALDLILENENLFISQLEADIRLLNPHIDKFSNKSFEKNLTRLNAYICELKQYNNLVANSQGDVVDVDFFSIFNNYIESSILGINKDKRLIIKYFVDDKPIPFNMLDDSLKSKFIVHYCLPCMNLVPTQIIDNAFKYAPANSCIEIYVYEFQYYKKIVVRNMGPEIETNEKNNLFEHNYRGKYAKKTGIKGNGLGLSLVKSIMDTHKWLNADLDVGLSAPKHKYNNIPYIDFSISLFFSQNEIDPQVISQHISNIKNDLMQYILHEYIRIAPHICKLGMDLFRQSFAKDSNVKNIEEIRKVFYKIKDNIVSNILFYKKIDNSFFVKDIPYGNCVKAFSKQLISEVEYVNILYNDKIRIESNDKYYTFVMYPPMIDIFIHEFAKLIIKSSCKGDILEFRCDKDGIEITSDNSFNINQIDLAILKDIMFLHNMNIDITNTINIYRMK